MQYFDFAGIGVVMLDLISPYLVIFGKYAPGEVFPFFFTMKMFREL